jgi:hypothetical protein
MYQCGIVALVRPMNLPVSLRKFFSTYSWMMFLTCALDVVFTSSGK